MGSVRREAKVTSERNRQHICNCGLSSTAGGLKRHLLAAKARGRGDSHFEQILPHEENVEKETPLSSGAAHLLHSAFDAKSATALTADVGDKRRQKQQTSEQANFRPSGDEKFLDDSRNAVGGCTTARKAQRIEEPFAHCTSRVEPGATDSFRSAAVVSRTRRRKPWALAPATAVESEGSDIKHASDISEDQPLGATAAAIRGTTAATKSPSRTEAVRASTARSWARLLPEDNILPRQDSGPWDRGAPWDRGSWSPTLNRRRSYDSSGRISPHHTAEDWEDPEAAEADRQRAAIAAAAARALAQVRAESKAAALAAAPAASEMAAQVDVRDNPPDSVDGSLQMWRAMPSLSPQEVAVIYASDTALCGASHTGQAADDTRVSPEDVEAVLLWENPWMSLRCFGCGLYVLIFLREFVIGSLPLRGMTLAATGCLLLLGGNLATRVLRGCGLLHTPEETAGEDADAESRVRLRVETVVLRCFCRALPVVTAVAALLVRRLSGRDKIPALWAALVLWGVAVASEAQICGQATVALTAWAAVFSLPLAYSAGRRVMDALAEELLDAGAALLGRGSRTTVGLVASSIAAGWFFGGPSYYGKITIAAVSGCAAMLLHTLTPSRYDRN